MVEVESTHALRVGFKNLTKDVHFSGANENFVDFELDRPKTKLGPLQTDFVLDWFEAEVLRQLFVVILVGSVRLCAGRALQKVNLLQ